MSARPHDLEVADWMGLDTAIEGILLATEQQSIPEPDSAVHRR